MRLINKKSVAIAMTSLCVVWLVVVLKSAGDEKSNASKVSFYQDSMHPWIKSNRPGKCTVCAMDLTPIYDGNVGYGLAQGLVVLSSNVVTVANIASELVATGPLTKTLRVAGKLEPNESHTCVLAAPAMGRVEGLLVEYTGAEIDEGQPMVTFYSPSWSSRRQYLQSRSASPQAGKQGADTDSIPGQMVHSKLPATMTNTNDLGDARSKTGSNFFLDLMSPQAGTVIEKFVYKGQYVQEGDKMFAISDSSELWFQFEIYEHQLPWIHVGQSIKVTAAGLPGRTFDCTVTFIHPVIDPLTRTVHVRGEIENPMIEINGHAQRLLRFGMYAEGRLQSQSEKCLTVPRSSVLFPSDDQAYVFLDNGQGVYQQRQVKLGRQGDECWEVISGLDEGDRVVTSGNVLVDAQSQFNESGSFKTAKVKESKPSSKDMEFRPDTDTVSLVNETNQSLIQAVTANSPRAQTNSMGRTSRLPKASVARTSELPPLTEALSEAQLKASNEFFDRVGSLSLSLAEDNLSKFNSAYAALREHGDDLAGKFQPPHPWSQLILNLKVLAGAEAAKDIIEARRRFLIFSTNAAEFAKRIRKEDPKAKLKVFHCPMAPKPGLWVQTSGPLQNPYFGAEMLSCGEEVKP